MKTFRHRLTRLSAPNEQGMVSIMVTMVLMIVLSLIVLGFAQISRRNQRETLDQQLSTQAFYAAESGINDAAQLISNALTTGGTVYAKPTCAIPSTPAAAAFYSNLPTSTISSTANVSYSCLIVNPTPSSLNYTDVGIDPIVVPLSTSTGANFSTVTFAWTTKVATSTPINGCPTSTSKALLTTTAWSSSGCGYGVLRFDLVPTSGSSLTASSLAAATMTSFVVPLQSGGSGSVAFAANAANGNDLIGGSCNNTQCSLTITGLSANEYYARVSSLYRDVSLEMTGTTATSTSVNFSGAQTMIDATGKAQDVLRRIQVRVSTSSTSSSSGAQTIGPTSESQLPYYALGSGTSICKEFAATGSSTSGFFSNSAKPADGSGNQLCE